jgi:hypothetical protein
MCQRRPADPTDPGDAADLNHGVFSDRSAIYPGADPVIGLHICATACENQQFLNQARRIACVKVNS